MAYGQLPFPFLPGAAQATSSLVPEPFDVAIAGRPYRLDLNAEGWGHESIPLLRQQADQSSTPGEASLNPDDLWRRATDSWHYGAGQVHYDREESLPDRFRSSKGVDVWTRWQLSLLPDVTEVLDSSSTNLKMVVAGGRIYVADGAALKYTDDLSGTPSWTTVTGTSGSTITDLATDGYSVYIADGSDIYSTNTGASTASSYNTLDTDVIDYVKGRWMVGHDNVMYNVTSGTPPSALMTQANTDFSWVGFAEGTGFIYAGGQSGDKALIYKITVKDDASSLDAPVIAGELPDGETLYGIGGYLGFILLGTSAGVRFCQPSSSGELAIGSPQGSTTARAFEGQDSFVWFTWDTYDSTSSGLGRMDLRVLTDTEALTPAYASDLMVTSQAAINDVVTFEGQRVFSVSGDGVYVESSNLVSSGTLDSGLIDYGIAADKTAVFLDANYDTGFAGSHTASLAVNASTTFTTLGTHMDTAVDVSTHTFPVDNLRGEYFEVRNTLSRDSGDATTGPTLLRWVLRSIPSSGDGGGEFIVWPVLLYDTMEGYGDYSMDPAFELDEIKALRASRQVVAFQELATGYSGSVEDYEWRPHHATLDRKAFNGTCFVKLRKVV